ncbi:MAG: DMT family transporter [Bacteroidales bacterium]|nr:DMT family transporter [Bacteroidales bacterium]
MNIFRNSTSIPAIFTCLLWASAFVGIKIGLPYTTPLNFAGLRFFISGLLILPFAGSLSLYFSTLRKHWKIVAVISLLQSFLQYALFYLGINLVPASLAAIIIGAQPLFIAYVAHFLMPGDTLNWKKILIYMLGLTGIVLVSLGRHNFSISGDVKLIGILFLVMVNIIAGFANVFVAKDGTKIPALALSSSSMLFGGILLYLVSLPLEGFTSLYQPLPYYLSLFYLSVLSAVAISIWFILLKRPGVKVSDLNFWKFLIPIVGAVLSWIILPGEKINIFAFIGMITTAGSLVLLNIHKRRNAARIQKAG